MKLHKSKPILIVLLVSMHSWIFFSCVDQEPQELIDAFTVSMIMPADFGDTVHFANQLVTLKSNRINYTAKTDMHGKVTFKGIIPGIYNISTHQEITNEVSLVGDTLQFQLFRTDSLRLKINKSIKTNLILSKIYASGTKDTNRRNYVADRYVEIFNNSDTVQFIDSTFYFGLVEAESVIAYPASRNAGFVFARQVFRLVTNNSKLALQPGQSILLTNSAIDHTQFSPNSVNLRNADFEAKNTTFSNNSDVKALELIFSAFPSLIFMNLINGGDNGAFLFKTTENVRNFPIFYIPGKETGNRYMRIPIQYVTDGVETLKNFATTGPRIESKRLQTFVDAGFMFISSISGYTNESIERRVNVQKSTPNRIYLLDTNNSSNDFRTVTDPTPRKYDKPLLTVN